MIKILQIPDCPWSIGRLCGHIRKYNPQFEWKLIYCPPRDISDHLEEIREAAKDADIINFEYWNVAWQLCEKIPELKDKKKILTFHTLRKRKLEKWEDFDALVVKTNQYFEFINNLYPGKTHKIENVPEYDFFDFNENYPPKEPAIGYVGRVVPWKGLKEIAKACYELKYPLYFMGRFDKPDYWDSIPQKYKDNIRFDYYNCPDEERKNFYRNITLYVGNSESWHEAGPLGFLESLAMGVPVVTSYNGIATDIGKDEENVLFFEFENYEQMKEKIKRAMEDESLRNKLRKNGFQAVKRFTPEYLAKKYEKLFNKVMFGKEPCVSVIIPATYDREEQVRAILSSLAGQTYNNIEAIVAWDEKEKKEINLNIKDSKITVKQVFTEREGYNLAMARNMAVVESIGEFLVFCDSRICPEKDVVEKFVNFLMSKDGKFWAFGDKGGHKESFVENFSAIKREHLINAGMFNERITSWGGASQEIRTRYKNQGFIMKYLPDVLARELKSSKMTPEKRKGLIKAKLINYKLFGEKTS